MAFIIGRIKSLAATLVKFVLVPVEEFPIPEADEPRESALQTESAILP